MSNRQATEARSQVDDVKVLLGERGQIWWDGGAPGFNRHLASNTLSADLFAESSVDRHEYFARF